MARKKKVSQLAVDQQYWYISIEGCCHFNQVKVVSPNEFKYNGNPTDVEGLIIFDNRKDAEKFRKRLQRCISPFIIK